MNTNHINWAVFFWVQAANCENISQKVNDFISEMGWDEDNYPQDTLLRQWHKVARVYYENVRGALSSQDMLNKDLLENWVTYTYKYWQRSCEKYEIEDCQGSYLDFLTVNGSSRENILLMIENRVCQEA